MLVALELVLREEATDAQLGMRNVSMPTHAAGLCSQRPLRLFAPPPPAQLVGLGVHHVVRDLLGEVPEQLLHIDGAVVETGLGEHVWRRV